MVDFITRSAKKLEVAYRHYAFFQPICAYFYLFAFTDVIDTSFFFA